MGVKLTEKKLVTAMNTDQTFLIVVDGALRRLSLGDLQKMMGNNIFYPSITLEQSSNPKFALPTPFMADMYQRAMGGYMMKVVNGKVYAAKLDPSNWEFFADGTKVDDASKYETMVHVPDCHFKADNKTLQFGGLFPISGGKTFDSPNWVGAYKMYVDGSGVGHSRPNVAPSHSRTMSVFWACAQKLGSNFCLANYGFQCLIEALEQVSFGDLNTQSVIGAGFQSSSWRACRDVPMVSHSVMAAVRYSITMLLSIINTLSNYLDLRIYGVRFGSSVQASVSTWMAILDTLLSIAVIR